ncbi:MAG: nucleotide sugar dehydrogenase [Thermoprotei archaeon]|nr:MAG: nucleotide sugar dehydrogenase [Thermoprotei archaeon]
MVDRSGKPDYCALEDVAKKLGEGIRKGSLIVVESTVGPGVTENVFGRVIEEVSGMNIGKDLFLAYSPIRAMAGRTLIDLVKYPRILGANDDRSFMLAKAVLSLIVEGGIIKVSNIKTAELTKLCENIYRDVNIALINQIAVLCERLGIDVYEVIEAANTQPYCHLHLPGIGVGGHCIPVNPYFLLDVADREGIDLTLVKEARRVNDSMPIHVVKLIVETLRRLRGQVERAKVAVLGITYRGNVKEHRYSPVLEVIDGLSKLGVEVVVFDPLYTKEELASIGVKGVDSLEEAVRDADCIVIGADHDEFKDLDLDLIARLARKGACIVEGRHVIKRPEDVLRRGLKLRGVGRPYYG